MDIHACKKTTAAAYSLLSMVYDLAQMTIYMQAQDILAHPDQAFPEQADTNIGSVVWINSRAGHGRPSATAARAREGLERVPAYRAETVTRQAKTSCAQVKHGVCIQLYGCRLRKLHAAVNPTHMCCPYIWSVQGLSMLQTRPVAAKHIGDAKQGCQDTAVNVTHGPLARWSLATSCQKCRKCPTCRSTVHVSLTSLLTYFALGTSLQIG